MVGILNSHSYAQTDNEIFEGLSDVTNEMLESPPPQDLSLIHISEPTRLGMISYAVFCLKKKSILTLGDIASELKLSCKTALAKPE